MLVRNFIVISYNVILTKIYRIAALEDQFLRKQNLEMLRIKKRSIQSLDLCGHKMGTQLGIEPRPPHPQADISSSQGLL